MIFWTDNHSEPKKVNIKRSKDGCDSAKWSALGLNRGNQKIDDFNQHTLLIIDDQNPQDTMYNDAVNSNLLGSGNDGSTGGGGGTWVTGGGGITPNPVEPKEPDGPSTNSGFTL